MDADNDQQTQVTTDADSLLKEVLRSQRKFRSEVIWSDVVGVGISLLLLPAWISLGMKTSSPWTWYLTVPVLIWDVVFTLTYRMRHRQKPSEPGEPLLHCVRNSLTQAEDQIWLQRNIFWWKLLPLFVSLVAFFVHLEWLKQREDWSDALDNVGLVVGATSAVAFAFFFIYLATQYAVRSKLEPRRQELLALLANLGGKTSGKGSQVSGA